MESALTLSSPIFYCKSKRSFIISAPRNLSSSHSVFPVEACETVGGDACLADMFPEAKLERAANSTKASSSSEAIERDYMEYTDTTTVLVDEACEVLGEEFCKQSS